MNPIHTGMAATGGAMMGGVVLWVCTVAHVNPLPPPEVADTVGAVVLMGLHYVANWLNSRFAVKATGA